MSLWLRTVMKFRRIVKMMAVRQKWPLTKMGHLKKIPMVLVSPHSGTHQTFLNPLKMAVWCKHQIFPMPRLCLMQQPMI